MTPPLPTFQQSGLPELYLDQLYATQVPAIMSLDNMFRDNPSQAEATARYLMEHPDGANLDEARQQVATVIGAALRATDNGRQLFVAYDDTTTDTITRHPDFAALARQNRDGTMDTRVALFGLSIYASRLQRAARLEPEAA